MQWTLIVLTGAFALGAGVCIEGKSGPSADLENSPDLVPDLPEETEPDINFPDPGESQEGGPNLSEINWNETLDYLLSVTNNDTLSKGRDEIPIKDVLEHFTRKLGPLTVRGEFTATEGHLKGLSSVRRKGDVRVSRNGTTFTMTCPVGLDSVRARYDRYRIKIHRGPSVSGAIEGEIGSNTVQLTASLEVTQDSCSARLDEVRITDLEGLRIRVLGLRPPLDDLLSAITNWLTDVFKNDIRRNLERWMTRELTKSLERNKCERYASYFIFVDPK